MALKTLRPYLYLQFCVFWGDTTVSFIAVWSLMSVWCIWKCGNITFYSVSQRNLMFRARKSSFLSAFYCIPIKLLFYVLTCVCLSAGLHKITEWISTKQRWRTGLGPEQTPITFGVDAEKGTDPRLLSLFLYRCETDKVFVNILVYLRE